MSERGRAPEGGRAVGAGRAPEAFDRELDLRGILGFAALVAAATVLLHLIVWGLLVEYRKAAVRRDPAPSPLAEANEPRVPPGPRLQGDPASDMEALRGEETRKLSTYGWIDRPAGVGRIPIDRAIDLILERGLPEVSPPPAGAATGAGAESGTEPPPRRPAYRQGRGS